MERFTNVDQLDVDFVYPADFDPERYLSSAFTLYFGESETFKICFPKDQARYISERIWAVDQKIETRKDGSLILTMTTSGGYDIKKWVLSFGGDAELLEPQWMRDKIVEEMERRGEPFRLVVTMDHYTPIHRKTHEDWPVPMFIYDSRGIAAPSLQAYTEAHVLAAVRANPDLNLPSGAVFFRRFVEQEKDDE